MLVLLADSRRRRVFCGMGFDRSVRMAMFRHRPGFLVSNGFISAMGVAATAGDQGLVPGRVQARSRGISTLAPGWCGMAGACVAPAS